MSNAGALKARELEILQLLAEGLTDGEIGARLHLAHETVRWHNKHIYEKLGVSNRTQAVNRALALGLLKSAGVPTPPPEAAAPARPPIRYAVNGGVHIAYQVIGEGPVDLLFIHGFLSHLELAWEEPEFVAFFERLSRSARVILFDKRGVGLSDRVQGAPTLEDTISDACCVLDAAGSRRAFVMGTSEGGAAAVLLASTYPERVHGLILYATTPVLVRVNDEPAWVGTDASFAQMIERMQKQWGGPWAIEGFAPSRAHEPRFREWWSMILRAASSPSSVKAVLDTIRAVDIRPILPQVRVRTLVIHKTGDQMVSVEAGRYLAAHLPNANWVELPGADHIYFVDSAAILEAVEQFCRNLVPAKAVDTWIATVLNVTAVDGEAAVADMQTVTDAHQSRHSVRTAHGMIALFDSPTRAIRCAQSLREALPHRLKLCLHVGECHVAGGEPTQGVIAVTERAAQMAKPGEILITRTLRDILAGSGFEFDLWDSAGQPPDHIPLYTCR